MLMMIIFFLVCLSNERWLALFPAVTIVIEPHHRNISDTPLASSEHAHNLSWGLVEWSCVAVITTTLHLNFVLWEVISEIKKLHQELGLFFYTQLIFKGVDILKWVLSLNALIVWYRMVSTCHWKVYFLHRIWIFPESELRLYEMNLSCSYIPYPTAFK